VGWTATQDTPRNSRTVAATVGAAGSQMVSTVFMIVPALVATTPPIMAPATIFGDCSAPPDHFSQANLPPAKMILTVPDRMASHVAYCTNCMILSASGGASGVGSLTCAYTDTASTIDAAMMLTVCSLA